MAKTHIQKIKATLTKRKQRAEFWGERRAAKSEREALIQMLLAEGLSDAEIATKAGVSARTVLRRRKAS